jgi:hypothetical protein
MKNIHILPTDNEQHSIIQKNDGLLLIQTPRKEYSGKKLNLYITSEDDINENDFIITKDDRLIQVDYLLSKDLEGGSKVIITTDPTLIDDGVQSIDDEFLEWFVKNPTCEFVEVNKKLVEFPLTFKMMYKIIIPQDEPKQDETGKYFADNADVIITMERPKEVRYSEDEVRELLMKGLTHNDDKLCGSLVTVQKEIRTANFNVWFEENKKK